MNTKTLSMFILFILTVNYQAQGAEEYLAAGVKASITLHINVDNNIAKCNVEIDIPNVGKIEKEVEAPNYQTVVDVTPQNEKPLKIQWSGKLKFRGLNSVLACPNKGQTEFLVFSPQSIALNYYMGIGGMPKDLVKAAELYRIAAEKGDPGAQLSLADMYDKGEGVIRDPVKAAYWTQKSAEQGDALAQESLGFRYVTGDGLPKDLVKGREWLTKAAAQGNELAKAILPQIDAVEENSTGEKYMNGQGVAKDFEKSRMLFEKAEKQGNVRAQANLGQLYYYGWGVDKDYAKALNLYSQAAAKGSHFAEALWGEALTCGSCGYVGDAYGHIIKDSAENKSQGLELIKKAVAGGDSEGMLALADIDKSRQEELLQKAADLGNALAIYSLGIINLNSQNPVKAAKYFQQGVDLGYSNSMYQLGNLYELGRGIPKDIGKAKRLYEQASSLGDTEAAQRLRAINDPQSAKAEESNLRKQQAYNQCRNSCTSEDTAIACSNKYNGNARICNQIAGDCIRRCNGN